MARLGPAVWGGTGVLRLALLLGRYVYVDLDDAVLHAGGEGSGGCQHRQ
jgi:hypothetical protein